MDFIMRAFMLMMIFVIIAESPGMEINPGFECSEHFDCPDSKPACFDSVCMNLCEGGCGINAICNLRDRVIPVCYCPSGMYGDPFVKCYNADVKLGRCEAHSDCPDKHLCEKKQGYYNKCIDPCERCGKNALCTVLNFESRCTCPNNMTGNPYISCKQSAQPKTEVETQDKKDTVDQIVMVNQQVLVNSIEKLSNSTNRIAFWKNY